MADELEDTLRALREEVARLSQRLTALEAAGARAAPAPAPVVPRPEVPEEVLAVLCAAAAAFLGKRPSIKQIRVLSSASWAHQGRVSIQASHAIGTHR